MEVSTTDAMMLVAAVVVLAFVLVGRRLEGRALLTEPLVCLLVGIGIGPVGLGLLSLDVASEPGRAFLHYATQAILGLTIAKAALTLPRDFLTRHARSLAIVLLGGMTLMWLATSTIALVLAPGIGVALLLGALLAPTDPVLASTVVSGPIATENVPSHLRFALIAESGLNDGLAMPFVLLPLLALTNPGIPWGEWLLQDVLWEVVGAALIGYGLGLLVGWLFSIAFNSREFEMEAMTPVLFGLTFGTLALVHLLGADGILAVFPAALAFRRFVPDEWTEPRAYFNELVERALTPLFFVLFGAVLPYAAWGALGWPLAVFVALVILARRLPVWLLLGGAVPVYKTVRERVFAGWFGPIGVGTVFYVTLAMERSDAAILWPAASAAVAASVVIHGLSATPLSFWIPRSERQRAQAGGRA